MDKKKFVFPVWLGIATTWFGMHCGSGFATGTQYTIYYSAYGWMAIFMPLVTWTIMAASYYFIFEYARREQLMSYKDYAAKVYIRKLSGLFIIIVDLWSLFAQTLGEAGILAGCGSLFQQMGMNYWLGVGIGVAIVLSAVIFGATVVMKVSTALTMGLVVCIAILGFVGMAAEMDNFKFVLSTKAFPEGVTFMDALKGSFTYAGVQIGAMFALIPMAAQLSNKKDSAKAAIGGGILNVAMLMILGLVMIANYPKLQGEALPVLTALESLGIPALTWIYRIMLFLALISTGIGCGFAIVSRFTPYLVKWGLQEKLASAIIAIVLLSIGVFGSKFGLIAIFSKGYGLLSKMAWPLGILTALIVLPIRLSKLGKEKAAE